MGEKKKGKLKKFPNVLQEKLYLYDRMLAKKATARDLVRLSYLRDMITKKDYERFLEIDKACEGKE